MKATLIDESKFYKLFHAAKQLWNSKIHLKINAVIFFLKIFLIRPQDGVKSKNIQQISNAFITHYFFFVNLLESVEDIFKNDLNAI